MLSMVRRHFLGRLACFLVAGALSAKEPEVWKQGKLIPMEDVLEELSKDEPASETNK